MQQGFSKFYISALCLLLLCCTSCHRRNNPQPVSPVVEVPDEDSVFVVNELIKQSAFGEGLVKNLAWIIAKEKIRFKTFENLKPITTISGLNIYTVNIPAMGFDQSMRLQVALLLKRKDKKALIPQLFLKGDKMISSSGMVLPDELKELCEDDKDICTILLLCTHLQFRLNTDEGEGGAMPPAKYYINLTDIKPINDSESLVTFFHSLQDTALIPIVLPPQFDFNKHWPDGYVITYNPLARFNDDLFLASMANDYANTYYKTITEKGPCIFKILSQYRRHVKRVALPEIKAHYRDKSTFYFYSVPDLACYKIWYVTDKQGNKTAHIKLISGYRLWDDFYCPAFYDYQIPGC